MIKIKHSANILTQLWFRGVLCLYHHGRYLQRRKREHQDLV
jgi:hypothetical protein